MPPNVVVALLDAARADHLSCYGHANRTTPFIDELAAEGVRYSRAFSNSIFSLPSYASIFTGQHPSVHGAVDWSRRIERNTLVSALNEAGYATHAVSTHLVSDQFGIGDAFDQVELVPVSSRDLVFSDDPVAEQMSERGAKHGWDSEFEKYRTFLKLLAHHPSPKSVINGAAQLYRKKKHDWGWWDDDGGREAVDRAEAVVRDAAEPFFLFVNFVETHDPYRPPRGYIRKFLPDDVSMDTIREALAYSSVRATLGLDAITEAQREILRALYDAEIAYVDDQLRRLYETLEAQGVAEDTVFVVLSDHGDFFGEHGLWGHQGHVFNEACRVPLVIRYPWETGRVEDGVVELRQLCEHLSSLAAGERTELEPAGEALVEYYGLDSQLSFVPWEEYPDVAPSDWGVYECGLVDDGWKLRWTASDETSLYDLDADFAELNDRSGAEAERVERLKGRVEALVGTPDANHQTYRSAKPATGPEFAGETGADVEERLRELGYLG